MLSLLVVCIAFVSTFAQNLQNHIPKDASVVLTLNPAVLNSKIKFSTLKEFDFVKKGIEEITTQAGPMASEIKKFIDDPAEFGLDMMSSSYGFGKIDGKNVHMGFILKIADKSKFENLINTYVAPMMPVEKAGGLNYFASDGMNVAWNDKHILVSAVELDYQEGEEYQGRKDRIAKEGLTWMKSVMKGNPTNSIMTHPKFKMANVGGDDMNIWGDYETLQEMSQEMQKMGGAGGDPMTQMMQGMLSGFYKDSYLSMGLNFDKGTTKLDTKYFMNNETMDMYRKVFDAPVNKKFLKYIPKNNLGYMSINMNLANLMDILKSSDNPMMAQLPVYESMAVESLKGMGVDMSAEEMYKLWNGDIMFVVTGVKEFEKEVTTFEFDDDFNKKEVKKMKKEQLPEFIMLMSHKNKSGLLSLIDLGKQSSMINEEKGFFSVAVPEMPMDVFMKVQDDMVVVSNIKDVAAKKKIKKVFKRKNLIKGTDAAKILKSSTVMVWNIPETMKVFSDLGMTDSFRGDEEQMLFNMGKDSFKSIEIQSDKKIGQYMSSVMTLNFNNKNMNSLEQIFSMINEVFQSQMGGGSM